MRGEILLNVWGVRVSGGWGSDSRAILPAQAPSASFLPSIFFESLFRVLP